MSIDFATRALIEGEFQLPTEDRLELSVLNPGSRGTLTLPTVNKVTIARIRHAMMNLTHELYPDVLKWIRDVGAINPKVGVELFLELAQFSLPKLKAIAVAVSDATDTRKLSNEELQRIVSEQ